jgi:hypothetical protein
VDRKPCRTLFGEGLARNRPLINPLHHLPGIHRPVDGIVGTLSEETVAAVTKNPKLPPQCCA